VVLRLGGRASNTVEARHVKEEEAAL
jgi:hypothetical protein